MKKNMPIVNIVGGMINRDNVTVSGNQSIQFIESINIDVAFVVPSGASSRDGFTCGNYIESDLKRTVIARARKVVLLMDASKTNRSLLYTFADFEDIDCIISDEELPMDIAQRAREAGVEVIVAQ
jgi:DeoR/GlpR family transcriptional regulator of sugar metabolism